MRYDIPAFSWVTDLNASGEITVQTPASGFKVVVGLIEWTVSANATVDLYWNSNTPANRIQHLTVEAGAGKSMQLREKFVGPADGVLKINASAGTLTGTIAGSTLKETP